MAIENTVCYAGLSSVDVRCSSHHYNTALLRVQGNRAYVQGGDFYGHAIRHYMDCLDHASRVAPSDTGDDSAVEELRAAAWANLAAIYIARQKYISAAEAAETALRASHGRHVKAAYRAAKVRM